MQIHTLGPAATDSCHAANQYLTTHSEHAKLMLHDRFETILENLSEWPDDLIVMPAAFQSDIWHESWGEVHYAFSDRLTLIDSFIAALDPLVVVENQQRKTGVGYTHAATANLLGRLADPNTITTTSSKVSAYQRYLVDGEYVLTNERNVTLQADEHVIARLTPRMVWCVYQINQSGVKG